MELDSASRIEIALIRVGDQLAFAGERFAIVIVGGAALNLLGIVERATSDVDILAFATGASEQLERTLLEPPESLPSALLRASRAVARDTGLDPDWLNTGPALQWRQGLPPGLASRTRWFHYGPPDVPEMGLDVGIASRFDLIFFKLYAAVDHANTRSVHYHDLLALAPTDDELIAAADWVRPQNASPEFHVILDDVVAHVRRQLRQGREKRPHDR